MDKILFNYEVNPTTWVYLSSLIVIGIYFKFGRLWSVRNLDLLALLAFAPGILLVRHHELLGVETDPRLTQIGYSWLFAIGFLLLVRLLIDPAMIRRPLLEPNLSTGGLTFVGAALFVFLMTNVVTHDVEEANLAGARQLEQMIDREEVQEQESQWAHYGPGYPLVHLVARIPSELLVSHDDDLPPEAREEMIHKATARTMAILAHLLILAGMVYIGYQHFGNIRTGLATASLYLLVPYTSHLVSFVGHAVPAALLVWALAAYRRPTISGLLLGLATGAVFYPVFLLPLWIAFYWQRGVGRFLLGFVAMLAVLAGSLVLVSSSFDSFVLHLSQAVTWVRLGEQVDGFWKFYPGAYRIPVMVAFVVLACGYALWPAQKNFGTLLSCSAAVMLGSQFWQPVQGGLHVAWWLPLVLLTAFRPNLEDRVALTVLDESWLPRSLTNFRLPRFNRAA